METVLFWWVHEQFTNSLEVAHFTRRCSKIFDIWGKPQKPVIPVPVHQSPLQDQSLIETSNKTYVLLKKNHLKDITHSSNYLRDQEREAWWDCGQTGKCSPMIKAYIGECSIIDKNAFLVHRLFQSEGGGRPGFHVNLCSRTKVGLHVPFFIHWTVEATVVLQKGNTYHQKCFHCAVIA